MVLSCWTSLGFLMIFCSACLSTGRGDSSEVSQSSPLVSELSSDDDDFGLGHELTSLQKELRSGKRRFQQLWKNVQLQSKYDTAFNQSIQSFYNDTRRLHASLSYHLRSLNGFMTCFNSCTRAHTDAHSTGLEGMIRYFCNKSCMMTLEQHHVQVDIFGHLEASTESPDTDALVG